MVATNRSSRPLIKGAIRSVTIARNSIPGISTILRPNRSER